MRNRHTTVVVRQGVHVLRQIISVVFISGVVFISVSRAQEQDQLQDKAVRVFLDMRGGNVEHIKREIPFVNYVRDRKQAQVYIMQTTQRTGAGGTEYTITLIGQQNFASVNDTVTYVSKESDTEEMTRSGIVDILKKGLMRYVEKTPLAKYITISYHRVTEENNVSDKWNFWVFNANLDYRMSGESSRSEYSLDGSFSADRVTPEMKLSLSLRTDYEERTYEFDDGTYISIRRSQDFRGLIVKSLSEHWSLGAFSAMNSSYYSNTKFAAEVAPAVEYNVFPYAMSTRREFRFLYKAAYKKIYYEEETIYFKTKEDLFYENLSATFELKERWGSLNFSLQASHYFHDLSKLNMRLSCNLNLRLFEGFSLDINGSYSAVRDQLSLRKGEASDTDILLHQREIASDYDFRTSIGFRYTFGSIYSNVVNPRFGSGGGRRDMRWFY